MHARPLNSVELVPTVQPKLSKPSTHRLSGRTLAPLSNEDPMSFVGTKAEMLGCHLWYAHVKEESERRSGIRQGRAGKMRNGKHRATQLTFQSRGR